MLTYISKWEEHQSYGGSEEGGWWFDVGSPEWKYGIPFPTFIINLDCRNKNRFAKHLYWLEDLPYRICRWLNGKEHARREREEDYDYTSVLSHRSTFYTYGFSDHFKTRHYPESRPHYE